MRKVHWLIILLLHFPMVCIGQVKQSLSLTVITGIMLDNVDSAPTYSSFHTRHSSKTYTRWSAGIGYQRSVMGKLGIKLNALYSRYRLDRLEEYNYVASQNRGGNISCAFYNESVLVPIQLIWQQNKLTFGAGLALQFHLPTYLEEEHVFFIEGEEVQRVQSNYRSGDFIEYDTGDWEKISLDNSVDYQFVLSATYFVANRLAVEIQFRDRLSANGMFREIYNYDAGTTERRLSTPFGSSSLSLGISWFWH